MVVFSVDSLTDTFAADYTIAYQMNPKYHSEGKVWKCYTGTQKTCEVWRSRHTQADCLCFTTHAGRVWERVSLSLFLKLVKKPKQWTKRLRKKPTIHFLLYHIFLFKIWTMTATCMDAEAWRSLKSKTRLCLLFLFFNSKRQFYSMLSAFCYKKLEQMEQTKSQFDISCVIMLRKHAV